MVAAPTPVTGPARGNLRWWENSDERVAESVITEYDMKDEVYRPSYGTLVFSPSAIEVIIRFLNQILAEPVADTYGRSVKELSQRLRRYLKDLINGLRRGDRRIVEQIVGPDRTSVATTHLGLASIRIIHEFLSEKVTPPTGCFDITVCGIQEKLLAHYRAFINRPHHLQIFNRPSICDAVGVGVPEPAAVGSDNELVGPCFLDLLCSLMNVKEIC